MSPTPSASIPAWDMSLPLSLKPLTSKLERVDLGCGLVKGAHSSSLLRCLCRDTGLWSEGQSLRRLLKLNLPLPTGLESVVGRLACEQGSIRPANEACRGDARAQHE